MFNRREREALGAVLDNDHIVMRLAGKRVLIDVADLESVAFAPGRWVAVGRPDSEYIFLDCMTKRHRRQPLHRYLTGWALVDHINGNIYDNRRQNLRRATPQQNAWNSKMPVTNTSGFKGVSRSGARFTAQIGYNRKLRRLGTFSTAEEAAEAYDKAAIELFGEFAALNFPRAGHRCAREEHAF